VKTETSIPKNKLDIIIRDNETGKCQTIDIAVYVNKNMIKNEADKILKQTHTPYDINTAHVECNNIRDASYNRSNRNTLRIIQKICEQHIWEARYPGNTENSHTGRCADASENSYVDVQNVYRGK